MRVTKYTTLGSIMQNYSNARKVLQQYGMHCPSCPLSQEETIEEAGIVHAISVRTLVRELNKKLIPKEPPKK